ncbi:hypothetical protein HK102_012091 [Quaeritorhiza haematococci]|nr:hypothetical protein HK102_012091 [Quaeritorhiza haematococci]
MLPDLWFEGDGGAGIPPPTKEEVEEEMRMWLRSVGKDLSLIEEPSSSSSTSFRITDKLPYTSSTSSTSSSLGLNSSGNSTGSTRFQVTQDSNVLLRLAAGVGNLGFNVASTVIGTNITNTVVDVSGFF